MAKKPSRYKLAMRYWKQKLAEYEVDSPQYRIIQTTIQELKHTKPSPKKEPK